MTDAQIAAVMADDKKYRKGNNRIVYPMFFGLFILIPVCGILWGVWVAVPIVFVAFAAVFAVAMVRSNRHAPLLARMDAALSAITAPVIAELFGPYTLHERQRSIDKSVLEASGFFKKPQQGHRFSGYRFTGGDMVSGTRGGTRFAFSDVDLYTSGEDHTTTYFKGQWLVCETAKVLNGQVHVVEREKRKIGLNFLDNHVVPGVPVEMENAAFNEKYAVTADDPMEAFLVLTPHFMEYIVALDEAADARTYFWFEGRNAHCGAFNYRNLFSLSNYMDAEQPTVEGVANIRWRFRSEAKWIADVLDAFLRNESLFPRG
jgi:hypothetical protein